MHVFTLLIRQEYHTTGPIKKIGQCKADRNCILFPSAETPQMHTVRHDDFDLLEI